MAVDVEDGSDWETLCAVLERPDLRAAERDHASELERQLAHALGEWVSRCSAHTAMHHLQRAGLAAGVVQDMEDLWRDPQLGPEDCWTRCGSRISDPSLTRGPPSAGPSRPGESTVPPARLGEHTRDVLRRWLGAPDDELERWENSGAIFSAV